jgi:hypothetical protein
MGHVQVSNVAENLGAGVHFNAFVPWKDKVFICLAFREYCWLFKIDSKTSMSLLSVLPTTYGGLVLHLPYV